MFRSQKERWSLAPRRNAIHAELIGSDICSALGITARGFTPVLALCGLLVTAAHDPNAPLEAWRDTVLCLKIRTIGEAADLEVRPASGSGAPTFIRTKR